MDSKNKESLLRALHLKEYKVWVLNLFLTKLLLY